MKAALAQANDAPDGQTAPGTTYYGECNGEKYAVAQFEALPGDTDQQRVAFQDNGSAIRFFAMGIGGRWNLVGNVPYDQPQTCATFTQAPSTLRQLWHNCPED